MEEVKIDRKMPLWWVLLVIFFMATIYYIGATSNNEEYFDNVNPYVVENLNDDNRE